MCGCHDRPPTANHARVSLCLRAACVPTTRRVAFHLATCCWHHAISSDSVVDPFRAHGRARAARVHVPPVRVHMRRRGKHQRPRQDTRAQAPLWPGPRVRMLGRLRGGHLPHPRRRLPLGVLLRAIRPLSVRRWRDGELLTKVIHRHRCRTCACPIVIVGRCWRWHPRHVNARQRRTEQEALLLKIAITPLPSAFSINLDLVGRCWVTWARSRGIDEISRPAPHVHTSRRRLLSTLNVSMLVLSLPFCRFVPFVIIMI